MRAGILDKACGFVVDFSAIGVLVTVRVTEALFTTTVGEAVLSTEGALNFLEGIFGTASLFAVNGGSPDFARSAFRRAGFFLGFFDAASCDVGSDAGTDCPCAGAAMMVIVS